MDDEDIVLTRVPRGTALPRQPSPTLARDRRKTSNPATSPDSRKRHNASSGKSTVAEERSDSPLLRAPASTTVERPLSGTYSPTRFGATAASKSPQKKYGTASPQPSAHHEQANRSEGASPSPTHPVHEPLAWNQNPQLVTQARPVNSSTSSRPEAYTLPSHTPAQAHAPTHTSPPSQDVGGGGVVRPNKEQHSTSDKMATGYDYPPPVSSDENVRRSGEGGGGDNNNYR